MRLYAWTQHAAGPGGRVDDKNLHLVESVAFRILLHFRDLAAALTLEHFVPLTDALHGSTRHYFHRRALELVAGAGGGQAGDPGGGTGLLQVGSTGYFHFS